MKKIIKFVIFVCDKFARMSGLGWTSVIGFDGSSKVMAMNSSNRTKWLGLFEPTVQLNVVRNWLGSNFILRDKFISIGSDIADPR